MNWKKGIEFGILGWVIIYNFIYILLMYKMPQNVLFATLVMIFGWVVVYFMAKYLSPKNLKEAIEYGLIFALIGVILDFLIFRVNSTHQLYFYLH